MSDSDFYCLDLIDGRQMFLRLSFDPFSGTVPTGMITVSSHVYFGVKMRTPSGGQGLALIRVKDDAAQSDPPYIFNMAHVMSISRVNSSSKIIDEIKNRESQIVLPTSKLLVT